jgi:hypothetical protein
MRLRRARLGVVCIGYDHATCDEASCRCGCHRTRNPIVLIRDPIPGYPDRVAIVSPGLAEKIDRLAEKIDRD